MIKDKIIISSVCVAVLLILSCKKGILSEKEPNNSFSSATKILVNSVVEGFIDSKNDIDLYKFDITEPLVLDIQLSAVKGINHAFKIWRFNGKALLLKMVDDLRKSSPERMCNYYFKRGTYYISILHGDRDVPKGNKETPYRLTLKIREKGDIEEQESNDSHETSNPIQFIDAGAGFFSPSYNRLNKSKDHRAREEDWYHFDIRLEGKAVLVDAELSGVPGINSILYLYNSDMDPIGVSDINGNGLGETIKGVGIKKSGRYFLLVAARNYEANTEVPYNIKIFQSEYDSSLEMEPNNSSERANQLRGGRISGKIFPDGDIDFFVFKGETDKMIYSIEVSPPSGVDILFRLYNSNNEKLFEIDNERGSNKEIMPNFVSSGDFFVEIISRAGPSGPDMDYSLKISSLKYHKNFEIEPNDSMKTASRAAADTITGYMSKKGDIDYFSLNFRRRVKCRFNIKGVADSEITISITDPLGYIIKSKNIKGDRTVSIIEMIDSKGYVIVEAISENYEDPYIIDITEAQ